MISVKNLRVYYGLIEAVKGISFEVATGQIVSILGSNGAGKTSTLNALINSVKRSGEVNFLGYDTRRHLTHTLVKMGISLVPEGRRTFINLSVEENLLLGAEILYKDKDECAKKVDEMLNLLNIEPIRLRKGVSLSGGERRRCEIARSLMITPKFLLLDEPFAGVDPIAVSDIQSIVRDLKKLGIGVLITDHNVRETLAICDRAYVIKDGFLLASGSAKEVANDKNVRTHYLGEEFRLLD